LLKERKPIMKRHIITLALVAILTLAGTQVSMGQLSGSLSGIIGPGEFHVTDTISVASGDSLVILPGTTFIFDGYYTFEIRGALLAEGTLSDSIFFTTDTLINPERWNGLGFFDASSSGSRLDFCVIENGRANDGGGVHCDGSSPTFNHCLIQRNIASRYGGGVYCKEEESSPAFNHCLFQENFASQVGGGVCAELFCSTVFFDCVFRGNFSECGGGICAAGTLVRCLFERNRASWGGGGAVAQIATFSDCVFLDNESQGAAGGLYCPVSCTNCIFINNSAATGGAVWMRVYSDASPPLMHCVLIGNHGTVGGAVYLEHVGRTSGIAILNTIIAFSEGSGIHFFLGCDLPITQSPIEHCAIFGNTGGVFTTACEDIDPYSGVPLGFGQLVATNANGDSCDPYHNIFLAAMFQDTAAGNYHLTDFSHCIGAGDPTNPPPTDMEGNPRPNPPGSNPDIGAFESPRGVPASASPCVPEPQTIVFTRETPGYSNAVCVMVRLCHDVVYTVLVPLCRDDGWPGPPAEIHFAPPYPWHCQGYIPECPPASFNAQVGSWTWLPLERAWTTTITLPPGGTEGCAAVEMDVWLEGWFWNGDCWLAVELSSLDAVAESDGIRVRFSTASESDNDYFEILRGTSQNGSFSTIARVPSHGNSTSEQQYQYLDRDVTAGETYWYYLADVDLNGTRTEHRDRMVSAVWHEPAAVPDAYALHQNYPNPFNPTTRIAFDLVEGNPVTLMVYDVSGRSAAILLNNTPCTTGSHEVVFDAGSLPSGVYFYAIKIGTEFTSTKKMMLIK
jgi:hypothetical protein